MKSKPRARKPARKPAKKAAARKKPAVKAVARGPRRATVAKRSRVAKKPPASKAKRATAAMKASTRAVKKPTRVAKTAKTKSPAPKKPVRKAVRRRSGNGRVPVVREFTKREAWALFDSEARKRTGMSGKEFIEWWHRGEFEKDPDDIPGVMGVAMLLPLVEAD